jgi:predicted HD phosphohydrolase
VDSQDLEALRKRFGGPMSSAEIEMLHDMQAFIDVAIRNGASFAFVMANLGHDVNAIVTRYGFDLESATADGFKPKVTGYSKVDADVVGQPEEPIESP